MVTKEEFRFPSRDGHTQLYAVRWTPGGQVKALVHICHNLIGYMGQFEPFAEYLAESGYLVFGHDLLGHGLSAEYEEDLGYFGPTRGDDYVLADILMLTRLHRDLYPEKPMILLGAGMGSLFVRRFLFTWPEEVSGAILLSTYGQRPWRVGLNRWFLQTLSLFRKERCRPKRLYSAYLKRLSKSFVPRKSSFTWVSSSQEVGQALAKDPYANFVPTCRLCSDLNHTFGILAKDENVLDMPKDSPILILYGEDDPIGGRQGRGADSGVAKESFRLASLMKQGGIQYVSLKGYPRARHDLLHEQNANEVQEDIRSWLEACLYLLD